MNHNQIHHQKETLGFKTMVSVISCKSFEDNTKVKNAFDLI